MSSLFFLSASFSLVLHCTWPTCTWSIRKHYYETMKTILGWRGCSAKLGMWLQYIWLVFKIFPDTCPTLTISGTWLKSHVAKLGSSAETAGEAWTKGILDHHVTVVFPGLLERNCTNAETRLAWNCQNVIGTYRETLKVGIAPHPLMLLSLVLNRIISSHLTSGFHQCSSARLQEFMHLIPWHSSQWFYETGTPDVVGVVELVCWLLVCCSATNRMINTAKKVATHGAWRMIRCFHNDMWPRVSQTQMH